MSSLDIWLCFGVIFIYENIENRCLNRKYVYFFLCVLFKKKQIIRPLYTSKVGIYNALNAIDYERTKALSLINPYIDQSIHFRIYNSHNQNWFEYIPIFIHQTVFQEFWFCWKKNYFFIMKNWSFYPD